MRFLHTPFHALPLVVALASCGWIEEERAEAADAARDSTLAALDRALAESVRLADRIAAGADRILSPMPVMTPAEEDELRRYLNADHVAVARRLGVRIDTEEARDSLVAAGRLVALGDSTRYWIVRDRDPAWVVPHVPALLELLGERFQARLAAVGLPAFRFEVTSASRTAESQARLRGTNANAATGESSHEYGTTVDLSYAAFAPPAERPPELVALVPPSLAPHVERIVDLALESVAGRKSRELDAIFGDVLRQAQREGLAIVIHERQQTVHHVTVAMPLATARSTDATP